MIHKILSMLLCCVMLLGLLPMTALAATVKRVDVTINAQAGMAPDYTADIIDSRYALKIGNSVREKNGITWINNKNGNAMVVGADKSTAAVTGYTFTPNGNLATNKAP